MADGNLELDLTRSHPVSPGGIGYYVTAARVCLDRHHQSPIDFEVTLEAGADAAYTTQWERSSDADRRLHADATDATEHGAYCVALAAAYSHLGRMALRRTNKGTGADWWLVPIGADVSGPPEYDLDRDDIVKLEVSGTDLDSPNEVRRRLAKKVDQVRTGRVPVAEQYAAVVGFPTREVRFEKV